MSFASASSALGPSLALQASALGPSLALQASALGRLLALQACELRFDRQKPLGCVLLVPQTFPRFDALAKHSDLCATAGRGPGRNGTRSGVVFFIRQRDIQWQPRSNVGQIDIDHVESLPIQRSSEQRFGLILMCEAVDVVNLV